MTILRFLLTLLAVLLVIVSGCALGSRPAGGPSGGNPIVPPTTGWTIVDRPTGTALSTVTVPSAPAPVSRGVGSPNGSLGSVAFSWILSNDTVASGAVNQPYPQTPDRLLYVSATQELWTAFATPAPGEPFNTSVVNLTNGATDVLAGVGNVTGFALDSSVGEVFLSQLPPGGGGGQILAFGERSHELARVPISVGVGLRPTSLALAPSTGDLWISGAANGTLAGSVTIVSSLTGRISAVVPVGLDPTAIAFDPATGLAFVANSASKNLTALFESNGSRAGAPVSLPGTVWPSALAFDSGTGELVALVSTGSGPSTTLLTIDPLDGSVTNLGPLPGNATASTLAIDPSTGDAYVASEQVGGSSAGGGELLRWSFGTPGWTNAGFAGRNPDTQMLDAATDQDFV
ncbi:MAG: YncE family protein, partial [Candidatus Lutacidiplasmatales archaeon]